MHVHSDVSYYWRVAINKRKPFWVSEISLSVFVATQLAGTVHDQMQQATWLRIRAQ